jgi:trans-aconitate methyltransferase
MSIDVPPFQATDPDVYEHFMGRWSQRLAGPFLEFAGIRRGDHVLDVGCGTGVLTLALAEHGAKVVGIDAEYSASAVSNKSFPLCDQKTNARCGSPDCPPFSAEGRIEGEAITPSRPRISDR